MSRSIAWEKYENFVNQNLALSRMLMTGKYIKGNSDGEEDERFSKGEYKDEEEEEDGEHVFMQFPITQELLESIKLSSNFECWFGHADFDITHRIAKQLDEVEGIELLKVISRYRFLIGIGKAFSFTNVRKILENELEIGR